VKRGGGRFGRERAAGIRLPDIAVPLATASRLELSRRVDRAPDRLAGRDRILHSVSAHKDTARPGGRSTLSIEERYRNRDDTSARSQRPRGSRRRGYLLQEDVADLLKHAVEHYDWATQVRATTRSRR